MVSVNISSIPYMRELEHGIYTYIKESPRKRVIQYSL